MIKVQNLSRSFGDFKAVDDISFEVGAGKTTTIRMLTTLLSPSSGTIEMDGLDPARHQNEVRQFMAPGVIAMTVLFSSMFSGIGLLWDRQFGFLKETLVAPVSRIQIMLGRTCGSATTAMLQGTLVAVVCVIAGFRPVSLAQMPLGFGFLALTAIVFAAAGTVIGSTLKDMQGFQMVMNFLVLPLFFLSGALYPLDNLPTALIALTHLDPMTYGVDGMRAALINRSHFGTSLDALILLCFGAALTLVGAWRFAKIEV